MIDSTECPECGSADLVWQIFHANRSGVQDGRLRMHDISNQFVLSCNECSETVSVESENDFMRHINSVLLGSNIHE